MSLKVQFRNFNFDKNQIRIKFDVKDSTLNLGSKVYLDPELKHYVGQVIDIFSVYQVSYLPANSSGLVVLQVPTDIHLETYFVGDLLNVNRVMYHSSSMSEQ